MEELVIEAIGKALAFTEEESTALKASGMTAEAATTLISTALSRVKDRHKGFLDADQEFTKAHYDKGFTEAKGRINGSFESAFARHLDTTQSDLRDLKPSEMVDKLVENLTASLKGSGDKLTPADVQKAVQDARIELEAKFKGEFATQLHDITADRDGLKTQIERSGRMNAVKTALQIGFPQDGERLNIGIDQAAQLALIHLEEKGISIGDFDNTGITGVFKATDQGPSRIKRASGDAYFDSAKDYLSEWGRNVIGVQQSNGTQQTTTQGTQTSTTQIQNPKYTLPHAEAAAAHAAGLGAETK